MIEYIAPFPAISYPSFSQLNEAITDLANPQFSITADETSQVPVVVQEIPEVQVMERIQEQIADPIEAPLQEHVQLHTAVQIVHVPVPRIQSSTLISSAPPSAALAPVTEYNAPTPARAVLDGWIAHMTFEGETPAERVMLRRDAQEASAEQAAQELFADEMATAPPAELLGQTETLAQGPSGVTHGLKKTRMPKGTRTGVRTYMGHSLNTDGKGDHAHIACFSTAKN